MFSKPTVLILGAGASIPYGFPSADKLKAMVWHSLQHGLARGTLISTGVPQDQIDIFLADLRDSAAYSIDSFLEKRTDYLNWGKLAIASILLPIERTVNLFQKWLDAQITDQATNDGNWYQYIYNLIGYFQDLRDGKLSIITFNYDRSLEQYFFTSLMKERGPVTDINYSQIEQECSNLLKKIPILHIYGKLGSLPWETNKTPKVPYDISDRSPDWPAMVKIAADTIEIIPEGRDKSPILEEAQRLITLASRVYFLGFGFGKANVRRLFPVDLVRARQNCFYGTALNLPQSTINELQRYGFNRFQDKMNDDNTAWTSPYFPNQTIYSWLTNNRFAEFD
jgi:hypothetical protein